MCLTDHYHGSPQPLTSHTYVITCGIGKKLSKVAGNSASKLLKSTSIELSCITTDLWRIFQIGVSKYLQLHV